MAPVPAIVRDDAAFWAGELFASLQAMAARHSNAVLLVLEGEAHPLRGCRYPDAGLDFAAGRWRAFYHCHDTEPVHAGEHGHFHIYTTIGEQGWTHVAGLSIDNMGQPLQWFAVNRWVTDGPWLDSGSLPGQLSAAVADTADDLVGRWLLALLQLDRSGLAQLLARRDRELARQAQGRDVSEVLEDRALYTLATRRIDMQSLLENALLQPAAGMAP